MNLGHFWIWVIFEFESFFNLSHFWIWVIFEFGSLLIVDLENVQIFWNLTLETLITCELSAQIYIFHIYTRPKFTDPTFTQNQDLHKPKFTQLRFIHNQTQPDIGIPKFTRLKFTQKLNPNIHRPKFTQAQIYIHIFGQISNNPNLHNPNLHKTQIYTA